MGGAVAAAGAAAGAAIAAELEYLVCIEPQISSHRRRALKVQGCAKEWSLGCVNPAS